MKSLTVTAVSFARHLAGDMALRRKTLGIVTLVAAAWVFLGVTLFAPSLDRSPLPFVVYWLACAWLVLTIALLALYDILQVFAIARRERQELERNLKPSQNSSTKSPPSNTSPNS